MAARVTFLFMVVLWKWDTSSRFAALETQKNCSKWQSLVCKAINNVFKPNLQNISSPVLNGTCSFIKNIVDKFKNTLVYKPLQYLILIYLVLVMVSLFNIGCWQVQLGTLSTTQAITSITGNLFGPTGLSCLLRCNTENYIIPILNKSK